MCKLSRFQKRYYCISQASLPVAVYLIVMFFILFFFVVFCGTSQSHHHYLSFLFGKRPLVISTSQKVSNRCGSLLSCPSGIQGSTPALIVVTNVFIYTRLVDYSSESRHGLFSIFVFVSLFESTRFMDNLLQSHHITFKYKHTHTLSQSTTHSHTLFQLSLSLSQTLAISYTNSTPL